MNPGHDLFVQQEVRKALNKMQSERQRLLHLDDPMIIARKAQNHYGQAWARQGNPDYRRERDALHRDAEKAIYALFDKTPTIKMAYDCWQSTRGWATRSAQDFHHQWEVLKRQEDEAKKAPKTNSKPS